MGNVLSSDDFDACLAIVVCRIGPNFYAHLSQVAGHYKGDASGIWDRSRGSGAPEGTAMRSNLSRAFIVFPRR